MVIQRIQSLYLLIACALMCIVGNLLPLASINLVTESDGTLMNVALKGFNIMPIYIICMVTMVLQFVAIFLYGNLKAQMNVALVCMVLVWATMFVGAYVLSFRLPEGGTVCWLWPSICSLLSFLFTFLAYAGMKKDYRTLRSYDRLR